MSLTVGSYPSNEAKRVKLEVKSSGDFSGARRFDVQYFEIYATRLKSLKPVLVNNVSLKWPGNILKILHVLQQLACLILPLGDSEVETEGNEL